MRPILYAFCLLLGLVAFGVARYADQAAKRQRRPEGAGGDGQGAAPRPQPPATAPSR